MRWRWSVLLLGPAILLAAAELALRARYRRRALPAAPAGPGAITLVALGDSITAGSPTASWPAALLARLRADHPRVAWTMVNAGVPGDTAPLGYARFVRDVAAAGPRLVLIGFGLNDCHPARHALDRWYERRLPAGAAGSYLWRAVAARAERLGRRLGRLSGPLPELAPQPFPRTSPAGFSAALAALVARTRDIGARPVLLTMTPLAGTETSETRARQGSYGLYNGRIQALAEQRRVLLADLSAGAPGDAFEPDGVHLTASGHQWAAERIYETLAAAGVWAALAGEGR